MDNTDFLALLEKITDEYVISTGSIDLVKEEVKLLESEKSCKSFIQHMAGNIVEEEKIKRCNIEFQDYNTFKTLFLVQYNSDKNIEVYLRFETLKNISTKIKYIVYESH